MRVDGSAEELPNELLGHVRAWLLLPPQGRGGPGRRSQASTFVAAGHHGSLGFRTEGPALLCAQHRFAVRIPLPLDGEGACIKAASSGYPIYLKSVVAGQMLACASSERAEQKLSFNDSTKAAVQSSSGGSTVGFPHEPGCRAGYPDGKPPTSGDPRAGAAAAAGGERGASELGLELELELGCFPAGDG